MASAWASATGSLLLGPAGPGQQVQTVAAEVGRVRRRDRQGHVGRVRGGSAFGTVGTALEGEAPVGMAERIVDLEHHPSGRRVAAATRARRRDRAGGPTRGRSGCAG